MARGPAITVPGGEPTNCCRQPPGSARVRSLSDGGCPEPDGYLQTDGSRHDIISGRIVTVIATMDSAGRIVLPKAVRERAQLSPGIPLEVQVVDGRVVIEPASARIVVEDRGGLWVAAPLEPAPVLTQDQVDATVESLRAPAEPVRGRD